MELFKVSLTMELWPLRNKLKSQNPKLALTHLNTVQRSPCCHNHRSTHPNTRSRRSNSLSSPTVKNLGPRRPSSRNWKGLLFRAVSWPHHVSHMRNKISSSWSPHRTWNISIYLMVEGTCFHGSSITTMKVSGRSSLLDLRFVSSCSFQTKKNQSIKLNRAPSFAMMSISMHWRRRAYKR